MTYPLVGDLAPDGIPVAVTCRVLRCSKQAYYAWKASSVTPADLQRAHMINAVWDVHRDDPEFGYRFIADELADAGLSVSLNTVSSLCREAGIVSTVHCRRRSGKKADLSAQARSPPAHGCTKRRQPGTPRTATTTSGVPPRDLSAGRSSPVTSSWDCRTVASHGRRCPN